MALVSHLLWLLGTEPASAFNAKPPFRSHPLFCSFSDKGFCISGWPQTQAHLPSSASRLELRSGHQVLVLTVKSKQNPTFYFVGAHMLQNMWGAQDTFGEAFFIHFW
ncbi:hypothetical protein I79_005101 [Cricetulus griseus]|uniref:Uncharacterized protein n=1 Tax=Cricetulus griseus TaxID=10029 RepID=G3H4A1_CRIGR|nr:hypothetical protein I79_005101 [Cricetulus griseus]